MATKKITPPRSLKALFPIKGNDVRKVKFLDYDNLDLSKTHFIVEGHPKTIQTAMQIFVGGCIG